MFLQGHKGMPDNGANFPVTKEFRAVGRLIQDNLSLLDLLKEIAGGANQFNRQ